MAGRLTDHSADAMAYALGPGRGVNATGNMPEPARDLEIDDIKKLAEAGIKMDWNDIKYRIKPPPAAPKYKYSNLNAHLLDPLIARIVNNITATRNHGIYGLGDGEQLPINHLSAAVQGDFVHVFIHIPGLDPYVVQDNKSLYPSDQLIAHIMLTAKLHENKSAKPQDEQSAPAGVASQPMASARQQGKTLAGAYGGPIPPPRQHESQG